VASIVRMAEAVVRFIMSSHSLAQIRRRGADAGLVARVLASPMQRETVAPGRDVLQSLALVDGRRYLVRGTSKVSKCWKAES
jgi:hypothetical protein